MKNGKEYYDFTCYKGIEQFREYEHKFKIIVIIIIALITIILIGVTRKEQSEIDKEIEAITSAMNEKQLKADIEKQERLKEQEELKKQEEIRKQKEEERKMKHPILTDIGKENMKNIYRSEEKRAFLTFDDGPSNVTHQILDTLNNEGVKATFFVLGSNVKIFPETMRRIYDEGHYIANHGYTHEYSSIYSSTQAVLDEFNMCNDAVKEVLGEPEYNSHLFRFPGGMPGGKYADLKKEAKQLLEENDILSVDWNSLTGDAETQHPEAEQLMNKLKETTNEKNSIVILMHDAQAKKVTADMLPDIIKYLKEQGYTFKTFYDIIK